MSKSIRESINMAKEFMQLWMKFHQVYKDAMGKSAITPDEENAFLETKSIIARKFQTLADSITIDRLTIDRTFDVINQILTLQSISTLSEETLKKIENDWHESYISLNRLLGRLEAKKDAESETTRSPMSITQTFGKWVFTIGVIAVFVLLILFLLYILGILK